MTMPESVKTSYQVIIQAAPSPKEGSPFQILIGHDEVMVLLGLHYFWTMGFGAGNNVVDIGLWRKTDTDPTRSIPEETGDDMIWSEEATVLFVTESISSSEHREFIFPKPLVLIRAPRLMWRYTVGTDFVLGMRLYYELREVTEVELAKLMIKDHA